MTLASELAGIVGSENVSTDEAARALAAHDLFVWPAQVVPDLVVRPADTEETSAVATVIARHGVAMVPRGGGLSYTAGVVPHQTAVVIDTTRVDTIEVYEDDLAVTVGAGCTWEKLAAELQPRGLRATLPGPISGSRSTIGGAVSQNVPGSMDGLIGLTVVLADGQIARTGSWALKRSTPFWRIHGPDLTGLFQGDCGAFGIKTGVALRLERIKPATFVSVAFENGAALVSVFVELLQRGLISSRAFGIDKVRTDAARKVGIADALRAATAVARSAGSIGNAVRDVAGLALAQGDLAEARWSLHITVESPTKEGAAAQAEQVRSICRTSGREIEPAVPKAMRAQPFSLRGFLGPNGERWVPVHGIVALSRARECIGLIEALREAKRPALEAAGISVGCLVSSVGAYMLFEPMIYWPDQLGPVQSSYLSQKDRERFGRFAANPSAQQIVRDLRIELRDLMDGLGAVHVQLGRFYDLPRAVTPGTRHLLGAIKQALDPDIRMNPGALGLPGI